MQELNAGNKKFRNKVKNQGVSTMSQEPRAKSQKRTRKQGGDTITSGNHEEGTPRTLKEGSEGGAVTRWSGMCEDVKRTLGEM